MHEQAGLVVINYLTTSLGRQQLQYESSSRERHKGRVPRKLAADVIDDFRPIGWCTSHHLSLFSADGDVR